MKQRNKQFITIFTIFTLVFGQFLVSIPEASAAEITSVDPIKVIPDKTVVTIKGSGFGTDQKNSDVKFGYSTAYTVKYWSDTEIRVETPSNVETGEVIEVEVCGDSYYACETVEGPSIKVRPAIDDIYHSETYSSEIRPGDTIKISGDGFGDSRGSVLIDNYSATINTWKDYSIKAVVPENADAGNLKINTSADTSSKTVQFNLITPPKITSISPKTLIPGWTAVEINGEGFGDTLYSTNHVKFNGVEVEDFYDWNDHKIKVLAPASVKNDGRVSVKVDSFEETTGPTFSVEKDISNDTLSIYQKESLELVNAPQAWNKTRGDDNVVVAVIDDGVYVNHPELSDSIWVNGGERIGNGIDDDKNGYMDDIYGWNFLDNDGEMTTEGKHGTMVAGIISAEANNKKGISGVAPNVSIMPLIACNSSGCDRGSVIRAIRYAADNGADVINLSISTRATTGFTINYNEAMKYAHSKGVSVVVSAGNGDVEGARGQNLNNIPQSPVCNDPYKSVIGVGASTNDGLRPSWSNYGTDCVDVYAPGEGLKDSGTKMGILSTAPPIYSSVDDYYDADQGTSFSAPFVSAAAALLRSEYPQMSPMKIRNRIVKHSDSGVLDVYEPLTESYDPSEDYGRVQGESTVNTDHIPNGALIRAEGSDDVYIVKYVGAKKFKRLVLSPSVFNSYGHLHWDDIMVVSPKVADAFETSDLVRATVAGDQRVYKLYPQGDTGEKRLITSADVFNAHGWDWDAIYTINETDRDSYIEGAPFYQ